MNAAELVDAAATGPVLVFGSPPPAGRDLDLLVPPDELAALRARLLAEGFLERGRELARFRAGTAEEVLLLPADDWRLPPAELDALFAAARPVGGYERLLRPAPAHALLVLARLLRRGGDLPEKRRLRARAALTEDPDALAEARRRAPAWGETDSLALLERCLASDRGPTRRERASVGGLRAAAARPRRPVVVALSGIDGSGKSTQARALADALAALGREASIEWAPLGSSPALRRLAVPLKRLLGRSARFRPTEEHVRPETSLVANPGTILRERSRAAALGWTTLVALANGFWHARASARDAAAGRVAIFDRYVLDSTARMRFLYGEQPRYRLQRLLLRLLSPAPTVAFFLDLSAEASLARKDDNWTPRDLERQVRLYREEAARLGITRLDAERPPDELAAEIAAALWRRL